ncbi:uncharacterized protein ACA1_359720 [Acanthamoeba castellanii str. Neff]|uniref:Uncharacterized protein n=1 Tax=Acanthamoeba castellanii (strain ATCC 30010 / Neff) TaxID=1257118 RepID=L8HCK9_ACACF|nr:uncharacterized protein ACA1_359720 [Acanthamoeba castellanii str. Neff]ELR22977.1 hypothetical protein ACA1_359720 [Acanthamoeba castellanii str. Neff]
MLMHSLLALDAAQDELRACTGRRASDAPPQGQDAAIAIRALSAEVTVIQEAADRWSDMAEKMVERLTTSRHPTT